MAPRKLELDQKSNGSFATGGLNSQKFNQAFNIIQRKNAQARAKASRTLTPKMLKKKSSADLAKLGRKADGTSFTYNDLVDIEKKRNSFEKRYNRKTAGISFLEIMAGSREIDIKRANNQVNDGSGITSANLVIIKGGTLTFRVKASRKNGKDDHRVIIRLENWDDELVDATPTRKGYQTATSNAVRDRMSIQCSCGRHQYWYRYLATIGNYCVAPPKEFSPPKQRNPNFSGVACKHVLHVANKMNSPSWINQIALYMAKQAKKVGYADDKRSRHVFNDEQLKAQNKTRKGKINQKAIQQEFERYERHQNAMANKQMKDKAKLEKQRKALKKKVSNLLKREAAIADREAKAKANAEKDRQQKGDLIRMSYPVFKDKHVSKGWTEQKAQSEFAKSFGFSEEMVTRVLEP